MKSPAVPRTGRTICAADGADVGTDDGADDGNPVGKGSWTSAPSVNARATNTRLWNTVTA